MNLTGLDIREGVSDVEVECVIKLARSIARPQMYLAEVGCWKGFTTVYLAEIVREYGGMVYAIDNWEGNPGTANVKDAAIVEAAFRHNLKQLKLDPYVTTLKMDSAQAASQFLDNSLDFVFIDADHRYTPFKLDLTNYFARVRLGGILCGHDCNGYYSNMNSSERQIVQQHAEEDYYVHRHNGIIKALYEVFNDKHKLLDGTIWAVTKPEG